MTNVIAKAKGYYAGVIREAGETFHWALEEGEKLPSWVEEEAALLAKRMHLRAAAPVAETIVVQGVDRGTTGEAVNEALGAGAADWLPPGTVAPAPTPSAPAGEPAPAAAPVPAPEAAPAVAKGK
jgi:hypothetical protein